MQRFYIKTVDNYLFLGYSLLRELLFTSAYFLLYLLFYDAIFLMLYMLIVKRIVWK